MLVDVTLSIISIERMNARYHSIKKAKSFLCFNLAALIIIFLLCSNVYRRSFVLSFFPLDVQIATIK